MATAEPSGLSSSIARNINPASMQLVPATIWENARIGFRPQKSITNRQNKYPVRNSLKCLVKYYRLNSVNIECLEMDKYLEFQFQPRNKNWRKDRQPDQLKKKLVHNKQE